MAIRTRARAKIEEDIAALAKEVSELRRKRGAGLPDVDTLVGFIVAVFEHPGRSGEVAGAVDDRGLGAMAEAVAELQIAPAAESLRAAVAIVFQAAGRVDYPAYKRESEALREALLALLEARAGKWRNRSEARDIYPSSWQSKLDPVEHVRAVVPKLTRWEVLAWSGKALACAVEDVWRWQLWQMGWREHQEDVYRRGHSSEPMWQSEIAEHTLPEEEAVIVDSWPIPPDEQWPDRNTREFTLPRLRKWQAQQGAVNGVSDQEQQR